VNCAVDIQSGLKTENDTSLPARRTEFRIGVNLGDVMVEVIVLHHSGRGGSEIHRFHFIAHQRIRMTA
jgi:hypothetical protein